MGTLEAWKSFGVRKQGVIYDLEFLQTLKYTIVKSLLGRHYSKAAAVVVTTFSECLRIISCPVYQGSFKPALTKLPRCSNKVKGCRRQLRILYPLHHINELAFASLEKPMWATVHYKPNLKRANFQIIKWSTHICNSCVSISKLIIASFWASWYTARHNVWKPEVASKSLLRLWTSQPWGATLALGGSPVVARYAHVGIMV